MNSVLILSFFFPEKMYITLLLCKSILLLGVSFYSQQLYLYCSVPGVFTFNECMDIPCSKNHLIFHCFYCCVSTLLVVVSWPDWLGQAMLWTSFLVPSLIWGWAMLILKRAAQSPRMFPNCSFVPGQSGMTKVSRLPACKIRTITSSVYQSLHPSPIATVLK